MDEERLLNDPREAYKHLADLQLRYRPISNRTDAQRAEIQHARDICDMASIRAGK